MRRRADADGGQRRGSSRGQALPYLNPGSHSNRSTCRDFHSYRGGYSRVPANDRHPYPADSNPYAHPEPNSDSHRGLDHALPCCADGVALRQDSDDVAGSDGA